MKFKLGMKKGKALGGSGFGSLHGDQAVPSRLAQRSPRSPRRRRPHAAAALYVAFRCAYFRMWHSSCTATNMYAPARITLAFIGVPLYVGIFGSPFYFPRGAYGIPSSLRIFAFFLTSLALCLRINAVGTHSESGIACCFAFYIME